MKNLYNVCKDIAEIEEKLLNGEISFEYDNLASAMKVGHPGEILDDILSIIGWDVYEGKEPSISKVKKVLKGLNSFQKTYKVDLKTQIAALKQYIADKEK